MADQILYYGSNVPPGTGVNKLALGGQIPEAAVDYIVGSASGSGPIFQAKLTLTSLPIAIPDATSGAVVGATKIFTFPQAQIISLGACADLTATRESTGLDADAAGDLGLGSVTPANASNALGTDATDDDYGTATEILLATGTDSDIYIPSDGVKVFNGTVTQNAVFLTAYFDSGAGSDADNLLVSGSVWITWAYGGGIA